MEPDYTVPDDYDPFGLDDDEFKAEHNCPRCGSDNLWVLRSKEVIAELEPGTKMLKCDFCGHKFVVADD